MNTHFTPEPVRTQLRLHDDLLWSKIFFCRGKMVAIVDGFPAKAEPEPLLCGYVGLVSECRLRPALF